MFDSQLCILPYLQHRRHYEGTVSVNAIANCKAKRKQDTEIACYFCISQIDTVLDDADE